ncbi:hypothetical protein ACFWXH_24180 [Mesorhizobium sp. NPDC059054]|uniref:hypothetical protein n=1 Tax=Mesorhizobium sp. NPDC059054 TaxID=3346711 RepID=UPI003678FE99
MQALAATMALAAPFVLTGEKGLFHFPDASEVRLQDISRAAHEDDWPFSVSSGYLGCVWSAGRKTVSFVEKREPSHDGGAPDPRMVIVTTDPFELTLLNITNRDLFAPADSVEALIKRVAPFEVLGEKLCDQPQGARLGDGEL